MDYKYRKGQIFGKKLKVPKYILKKVYNCTLSFNEFIKYELDNKIPSSCIKVSDRLILEKFGIEKSKTLDWELLDNHFYYNNINIKEMLMDIDPSEENINLKLYELVKDIIRPCDYSSQMKKIYSDRLFLSDNNDASLSIKMKKFNEGISSLEDIIENWDLYKNKDLSFCLINDKKNINAITDSNLKEFMINYKTLAQLITKHSDIYDFINKISTITSEEEKQEHIKHITDGILNNTRRENGDYRSPITLTNEEYKEIFKYSSLEDYLQLFNGWRTQAIIKELKTLPQDYIFNIPIPFSELLNTYVLDFIGIYGLKNIVEFDNKCGQFFTKNNCQMLKLMYNMYLHYGGNELPNKTIFTKNPYDENGNYIDRPYTKDEFYEAMRRMIIFGPTNWNYIDKAPDYRELTGEFRKRNSDLFISEEAPEELQKLFYTKSLTPNILVEHPEYKKYLEGINLSSCFKNREIKIEKDKMLYENFYNFISSKTDFNNAINFIIEYSDIFDILFDKYQYEITFSKEDNINEIQKKINETFKRLIIEKGIIYPKTIPQSLIKNYPSIFLSNDAPKELQNRFYSRTINSDFILSNENYRNYLKDIDLEVIYKYMPIPILKEDNNYRQINLISAIENTFGHEEAFDVLLLYGKYIESVFEINQLKNFRYNPTLSKDELLDELDSAILQCIIEGKMDYNENIPSHFKNNNPTLFLNKNISPDIKNKFYNREFTLNDFNSNPDLINLFDNTNIACGFPKNLSWIIPLFDDYDNLKMANLNRLKIISEYYKIQDISLQNIFKEYILEYENSIEIEKIEYVSEVLSRLSLTNSNEIFTFRKELANQILKSTNPLESLNKIEDIFIRNNIPTVGKIYSCFEILHPNFQGFNFQQSMVSPILKKSSNMSKKIIVFSDLIKTSFGSNNRSVNSYLKNIEIGSKLYESIKNGNITYDSLNELEKKELITFSKHLITLYNNTIKGKKESFISTGNVLTDILELEKKLSPDDTLDYNLADRIIKMFCGFAGIDTLEQAKDYIDKKIQNANIKNRNASNTEMTLEQGDFVKGIGDVKYLKNILQNGSVSKEYLGSSASSDSTPLDTDVSLITSSDGTTRDKINATAANGYGPIWFVLKNDERFITTRTNNETLNTKRDLSKMEVFYTGILGQGHYGIRTGFASSEIDYIVMEEYDPRVGLEVAMNGFYIPIANKDGKIVFSPNDYDKLREKMSGLSYFNKNNYIFSENLITEETEYLASQIEQSNYDTQAKRTKINNIIKKSLDELGLYLKTSIDGDLTEGFVELIDTGSTGRGTNKPGDGDFDFMMRLDKTILSNPSKLNELKQTLLKNFGKENSPELTSTGDFRLKNIYIDNEINVDIDITFTEKTDKVSYSTDMALQDRLATIKRIYPEKYKYVIANILLAKQILKQAEVYKPNRGEIPQGGLGGVGIENWILQNGGSFIDAAKSFVEAADGKNFTEFKASYQIWDFGDNHLAERRGQYSHDNFVSNNMSEVGYQKMTQILKDYLNNLQITRIDSENIKR